MAALPESELSRSTSSRLDSSSSSTSAVESVGVSTEEQKEGAKQRFHTRGFDFDQTYLGWREQLDFTPAQFAAYKEFINTNTVSRDLEENRQNMNEALRLGVDPSVLVIGLLNSSYHTNFITTGVHTNRLLIELIEMDDGLRDSVLTRINGISNPRRNVAQVAAISGSHEMLYKYWMFGGDIDASAVAKRSPPLILAVDRANFNCITTLLWLDAKVRPEKMVSCTERMSIEQRIDVIHELQRFCIDFQTAAELLTDIVDDYLDVDTASFLVEEFVLPLQSFRGVSESIQLLKEQMDGHSADWEMDVQGTLHYSEEDSMNHVLRLGLGCKEGFWLCLEGDDLLDPRSKAYRKKGRIVAASQSRLASLMNLGMDLPNHSASTLEFGHRNRPLIGFDAASNGYSRQITLAVCILCVGTGVWIWWANRRRLK